MPGKKMVLAYVLGASTAPSAKIAGLFLVAISVLPCAAESCGLRLVYLSLWIWFSQYLACGAECEC